MSKSALDPRSRILLTDSPEEIHVKLMAALTDSINSVSYDPENRPAVANLLDIASYFDTQKRSAAELGTLYADMNLRTFKTTVSQTISSSLAPIRTRYQEIMAEDDGGYLSHVRDIGGKKARESAEPTMELVRKAMGFWR